MPTKFKCLIFFPVEKTVAVRDSLIRETARKTKKMQSRSWRCLDTEGRHSFGKGSLLCLFSKIRLMILWLQLHRHAIFVSYFMWSIDNYVRQRTQPYNWKNETTSSLFIFLFHISPQTLETYGKVAPGGSQARQVLCYDLKLTQFPLLTAVEAN